MEDAFVVCMDYGDGYVPSVPSESVRCCNCNCPLWISDNTVAQVRDKGENPLPLCERCSNT